jgi:hypothetical protein
MSCLPTLALQLWAGYPLVRLDGMLSSNFVVKYSTNLAGTNLMNLLSMSNLPSSPYLFLDAPRSVKSNVLSLIHISEFKNRRPNKALPRMAAPPCLLAIRGPLGSRHQ